MRLGELALVLGQVGLVRVRVRVRVRARVRVRVGVGARARGGGRTRLVALLRGLELVDGAGDLLGGGDGHTGGGAVVRRVQ